MVLDIRMELEKVVRSLHQGEKTYGLRHNGQGNCEICIADEKNKNCFDYYPIRVYIFYVSEKVEKKEG